MTKFFSEMGQILQIFTFFLYKIFFLSPVQAGVFLYSTGTNCSQNIDDCFPNPCQNGGSCQDLVNAFSCSCTDEWMGETCHQEYDACSFFPCQNSATCSPVLGFHEYSCTCVPGYTDANCSTNIDDCVGVVCPQYQVCHDQLNNFTCACPTGKNKITLRRERLFLFSLTCR